MLSANYSISEAHFCSDENESLNFRAEMGLLIHLPLDLINSLVLHPHTALNQMAEIVIIALQAASCPLTINFSPDSINFYMPASFRAAERSSPPPSISPLLSLRLRVDTHTHSDGCSPFPLF